MEENTMADLDDFQQSAPTLSFDMGGAAAQMAPEPEAPAAEAVDEETLTIEKMAKDARLTEDEMKQVDSFVDQIDIKNSSAIMNYGVGTQKKMADFSQKTIDNVRTKDMGEVGDMITDLVTQLKNFDVDENEKGILSIFHKSVNKVEALKASYSKVETNVSSISAELEKHQTQLMKDVAVLDKMYELNLNYYKELTMYIIAGEKKLAEVRSTTLQQLKDRAAQSGDAMDAQRANDMAANCDRFEKKLHDLKLTRQVALQMAPQIRLLQNNDSLLVERIQSTLSNTLPLWKSQMVIALGLHRSQEALKAQTAVTDMTNELLTKNAEKLKVGTIETAREAERGVIDLQTLVSTNQSLIDTINEVMKIQDEGRTQRIDAEKQMLQMETELKKKLLELKH